MHNNHYNMLISEGTRDFENASGVFWGLFDILVVICPGIKALKAGKSFIGGAQVLLKQILAEGAQSIGSAVITKLLDDVIAKDNQTIFGSTNVTPLNTGVEENKLGLNFSYPYSFYKFQNVNMRFNENKRLNIDLAWTAVDFLFSPITNLLTAYGHNNLREMSARISDEIVNYCKKYYTPQWCVNFFKAFAVLNPAFAHLSGKIAQEAYLSFLVPFCDVKSVFQVWKNSNGQNVTILSLLESIITDKSRPQQEKEFASEVYDNILNLLADFFKALRREYFDFFSKYTIVDGSSSLKQIVIENEVYLNLCRTRDTLFFQDDNNIPLLQSLLNLPAFKEIFNNKPSRLLVPENDPWEMCVSSINDKIKSITSSVYDKTENSLVYLKDIFLSSEFTNSHNSLPVLMGIIMDSAFIYNVKNDIYNTQNDYISFNAVRRFNITSLGVKLLNDIAQYLPSNHILRDKETVSSLLVTTSQNLVTKTNKTLDAFTNRYFPKTLNVRNRFTTQQIENELDGNVFVNFFLSKNFPTYSAALGRFSLHSTSTPTLEDAGIHKSNKWYSNIQYRDRYLPNTVLGCLMQLRKSTFPASSAKSDVIMFGTAKIPPTASNNPVSLTLTLQGQGLLMCTQIPTVSFISQKKTISTTIDKLDPNVYEILFTQYNWTGNSYQFTGLMNGIYPMAIGIYNKLTRQTFLFTEDNTRIVYAPSQTHLGQVQTDNTPIKLSPRAKQWQTTFTKPSSKKETVIRQATNECIQKWASLINRMTIIDSTKSSILL